MGESWTSVGRDAKRGGLERRGVAVEQMGTEGCEGGDLEDCFEMKSTKK